MASKPKPKDPVEVVVVKAISQPVQCGPDLVITDRQETVLATEEVLAAIARSPHLSIFDPEAPVATPKEEPAPESNA